jgi:hypothetical protein
MMGTGQGIQVVVFGFIAILMAIVTIDRRRTLIIK